MAPASWSMAVGDGRGEEQVLARGGQPGENFFHVGQEAHVEHAVGLVQDQGVDLGQVDLAAVDEVQQPAGAGHDDGRLGQGLDLGEYPYAAEDRGAADARLPAEVDEGFVDLQGQLAGGREDEHAHRPALGRIGGEQALEDGQGESRGLARAGLGQAENVAAGEDNGHGPGLDGGRGLIAGGADAGEDALVEVEGKKAHETSLGWRAPFCVVRRQRGLTKKVWRTRGTGGGQSRSRHATIRIPGPM